MAPVPYKFYSRFEYRVVQESSENALEKEEVKKFLKFGTYWQLQVLRGMEYGSHTTVLPHRSSLCCKEMDHQRI